MSEDESKESKKDERFYEPRNWDKFMRIEGDQGPNTYCGKCGHIIYEGDRFCTKCGTESRTQEK